ncbi:endospore germination permease [Paenibacillus sp. NPDC058177]|uniref:GerAB/ArcD/ProY family transporter n=1 Tax=Paenibacillus sp. NPDC058177 TaxID=3346369 RepID=UPI0036DF2A50
MNKEILPSGQSISIAVLFIIGSSLFMGVTGRSGNSAWISLLIAMSLSVPLMFVYARLHVLFPGKNLFDMLIAMFGGITGRIISCTYIWYALHLGSLVLRNFGEFSETVALTETPMIAPMLCIGLLCVWTVYSGIEVLGRSAKFLLLFTIMILLLLQILAIPKFEYHHLKPVLDSGWSPILADAMGLFTFPFGEIVIFLGVLRALPGKGSAKKVFFSGLLMGGGVIMVVIFRNLLILGPDILSSLYFPAYVAVSRINVGDFLTRIEGSSAILFVTALYIKVSLCLYVASVGVAKVFKLKSYRSVVLQLGLLMVYLADFIYQDIMQMQNFAYHTYKIYALPFQVFFPLLLWIVAEIVASKGKQKESAP